MVFDKKGEERQKYIIDVFKDNSIEYILYEAAFALVGQFVLRLARCR